MRFTERESISLKKIMYYISPFIFIPCLCLLLGWMSVEGLININVYGFGVLLFIISAVIGNLSPNDKKFDYLITLLVPLALFLTMFFAGFLDTSEFHSGHDFERGWECAVQIPVMYLITAAATFGASFGPIRILRSFFRKRSLIK